jgi:hypothetical protein
MIFDRLEHPNDCNISLIEDELIKVEKTPSLLFFDSVRA